MAHEMSPYHRKILEEKRIFILNNFHPDENFWAFLLGEVFDSYALEKIKAEPTRSDRLVAMLDRLPMRGANAFDIFCKALVQSDNYHVAAELIEQEGKDLFRREATSCDVPENSLPALYNSFRNHAKRLVWLNEQKLDVANSPEISELETLECELMASLEQQKRLENKLGKLQTDVDLLQGDVKVADSYLNRCAETIKTLTEVTENGNMDEEFIREFQSQLDEMMVVASESRCSKVVRTFCGNMNTILDYLKNRPRSPNNLGIINVEEDGIVIEGQNLSSKITDLCQDSAKLSSDADICSDSITLKKGLYHKACDLRHDVNMMARVLRQVILVNIQIEDNSSAAQINLSEIGRLSKEIRQQKDHISEMSQNIKKCKGAKKSKDKISQLKESVKDKYSQVEKLKREKLGHLRNASNHVDDILKLLSSVQIIGLKSRPSSRKHSNTTDVLTASIKKQSAMYVDAEVQVPGEKEILKVTAGVHPDKPGDVLHKNVSCQTTKDMTKFSNYDAKHKDAAIQFPETEENYPADPFNNQYNTSEINLLHNFVSNVDTAEVVKVGPNRRINETGVKHARNYKVNVPEKENAGKKDENDATQRLNTLEKVSIHNSPFVRKKETQKTVQIPVVKANSHRTRGTYRPNFGGNRQRRNMNFQRAMMARNYDYSNHAVKSRGQDQGGTNFDTVTQLKTQTFPPPSRFT